VRVEQVQVGVELLDLDAEPFIARRKRQGTSNPRLAAQTRAGGCLLGVAAARCLL
jgi:hypothetical protein